MFTISPRFRSPSRGGASLLLTVLLALGGITAGAAQPIATEPRLDVYPAPARALEPVQLVFSWFTISCSGDPVLEEKSRGPGRIVLELLDPGCPLLPPGGYEYTLVKQIEIPDSTTIEVRLPGDGFVVETDVEVTPLEADELQVLPQETRFQDTERARVLITGNDGGCLVDLAGIDIAPSSLTPADGPTPIDIRLERGCILDPPLSGPFALDVELGRLPPGLYSVTATFESAESSRTELFEVYVETEPPSLSVSPTEPIDTDFLQVGITRPGQFVCAPDPALETSSTRIEVLVDSACWGEPFDQSTTVFVPVGELPAGRYLLVLLERSTNDELDRRVFDVEAGGDCVDSITSLCLMRNRFRATALWRATQGTQGPGHAQLRSDGTSAASGTFWFFDPKSVEIDLKVINGCNVNGHFWVFAAGLTDQGVILRIQDTVTGQQRVYGSDVGTPFQTVTDIEALPCF